MKTKRILITIILMLVFLLLCSIKVEATLELNELNFDVQVNEDGSMNITETWDIYISETNTLFKTFEIDDSRYSEITEVEVYETTDMNSAVYNYSYIHIMNSVNIGDCINTSVYSAIGSSGSGAGGGASGGGGGGRWPEVAVADANK